jgi:hypothetical protein
LFFLYFFLSFLFLSFFLLFFSFFSFSFFLYVFLSFLLSFLFFLISRFFSFFLFLSFLHSFIHFFSFLFSFSFFLTFFLSFSFFLVLSRSFSFFSSFFSLFFFFFFPSFFYFSIFFSLFFSFFLYFLPSFLPSFIASFIPSFLPSFFLFLSFFPSFLPSFFLSEYFDLCPIPSISHTGQKVSEILCLPEYECLTCGQVSETFRRSFVPIDLSISLENAIAELVLSDAKRLIAFGADTQPVGVLSESRIVFSLSSYLIASSLGHETVEQLFRIGDEENDSESLGFDEYRREEEEKEEETETHNLRASQQHVAISNSPIMSPPSSPSRRNSKGECRHRHGMLGLSGDLSKSGTRHNSASSSPSSPPHHPRNTNGNDKLPLAETKCFPDTETVSAVFNYLQGRRISSVAVCDAAWKIVGAVSVSDLRKVETLEVLSGGIDCELPISEFIAPTVARTKALAQPYPVIVTRACTLAVVVANFQQYKIHQIFVSDSPIVTSVVRERCVRVITLMDVILLVHRHFIERHEKKAKHHSKHRRKENRK